MVTPAVRVVPHPRGVIVIVTAVGVGARISDGRENEDVRPPNGLARNSPERTVVAARLMVGEKEVRGAMPHIAVQATRIDSRHVGTLETLIPRMAEAVRDIGAMIVLTLTRQVAETRGMTAQVPTGAPRIGRPTSGVVMGEVHVGRVTVVNTTETAATIEGAAIALLTMAVMTDVQVPPSRARETETQIAGLAVTRITNVANVTQAVRTGQKAAGEVGPRTLTRGTGTRKAHSRKNVDLMIGEPMIVVATIGGLVITMVVVGMRIGINDVVGTRAAIGLLGEHAVMAHRAVETLMVRHHIEIREAPVEVAAGVLPAIGTRQRIVTIHLAASQIVGARATIAGTHLRNPALVTTANGGDRVVTSAVDETVAHKILSARDRPVIPGADVSNHHMSETADPAGMMPPRIVPTSVRPGSTRTWRRAISTAPLELDSVRSPKKMLKASPGTS